MNIKNFLFLGFLVAIAFPVSNASGATGGGVTSGGCAINYLTNISGSTPSGTLYQSNRLRWSVTPECFDLQMTVPAGNPGINPNILTNGSGYGVGLIDISGVSGDYTLRAQDTEGEFVTVSIFSPDYNAIGCHISSWNHSTLNNQVSWSTQSCAGGFQTRLNGAVVGGSSGPATSGINTLSLWYFDAGPAQYYLVDEVSFNYPGGGGGGGGPVDEIPTVTLTANPTSGTAGVVSPTLTWTTTNGPTSCIASGDWSGSKAVGGGSQNLGVLNTTKTYQYNLQCSNDIGGSDDDADVVVTPQAASSIDLTANSTTPTSATVGTPTNFSSLINNTGDTSTGTSFNNFFQVATASGGAGTISAISVNSRGALIAGQSGSVSSSGYTFPSAKTYSVRACADNNSSFVGTITESNEANNCSPWADVIVSPAGVTGPDLTAGATAPTSVTVNTPTVFTSLIANGGNASTGVSFNTFFQRSDTPGGAGPYTSISTNSRAALAASSSGVVSSSAHTFPLTGTYSVRACADNNSSFVGVVSETDEGNNCSAWTNVTVTTGGTVSGIDLTADPVVPPVSPTYGSSLNFSATIRNMGTNSTVVSFDNFFQVSFGHNGTGLLTDLAYAQTTALAGNNTARTITSPLFTLELMGPYSVRICTDKQHRDHPGKLGEANEDNNCGAWTNFSVGPDLTVDPLINFPASFTQGSQYTSSFTVRNIGSSTAAGTFSNRTIIKNGPNGTGIVAYNNLRSLANIATGGFVNTTATTPYTFTNYVGMTHSISVCADHNNFSTGVITEADENNNCTDWINFAVNPTPPPGEADLVAGDPVPDETPTLNDSLTFTSSITNQGDASTSASFDNLFQVSDEHDGAGDISTISTNSRATLTAGSSGNVTSSSYTFTSTGQYSVRTCADSGLDIAESNDGNNCSGWTNITIASPFSPITAKCTVTPSPSARVLQTVVWSVTDVVGGNGIYDYDWSGSDIPALGSPTPTPDKYTIAYTTAGLKNAVATITDSVGNSGTCGDEDGIGVGEEIQIYSKLPIYIER